MVVNGNLEGIVFDTDGATTAKLVMNELKAKYNSPSSVTPVQVQRGKNKIDVFRAEWHLPNLFVLYHSVTFARETGVVYILTDEGNKWQNEQMKRLIIIV